MQDINNPLTLGPIEYLLNISLMMAPSPCLQLLMFRFRQTNPSVFVLKLFDRGFLCPFASCMLGNTRSFLQFTPINLTGSFEKAHCITLVGTMMGSRAIKSIARSKIKEHRGYKMSMCYHQTFNYNFPTTVFNVFNMI